MRKSSIGKFAFLLGEIFFFFPSCVIPLKSIDFDFLSRDAEEILYHLCLDLLNKCFQQQEYSSMNDDLI